MLPEEVKRNNLLKEVEGLEEAIRYLKADQKSLRQENTTLFTENMSLVGKNTALKKKNIQEANAVKELGLGKHKTLKEISDKRAKCEGEWQEIEKAKKSIAKLNNDLGKVQDENIATQASLDRQRKALKDDRTKLNADRTEHSRAEARQRVFGEQFLREQAVFEIEKSAHNQIIREAKQQAISLCSRMKNVANLKVSVREEAKRIQDESEILKSTLALLESEREKLARLTKKIKLKEAMFNGENAKIVQRKISLDRYSHELDLKRAEVEIEALREKKSARDKGVKANLEKLIKKL